MKDINDINQRDWRLQAITTLTKDFKSPFTGKLHKKGSVVENVNFIKIGKKELSMPIPNPTALFLNLSHISYLESVKFFNFFSKKDIDNLDLRLEEEDLFNGLEYYMASIIFAYTSLECYSNFSIPDDYIFRSLRQDKKCTELYNKEQIERNLTLKVKLGEILPEITGVEFTKSENLWNRFIELEKTRDGIIHMKSSDVKGTNKETKEISFDHIWNKLVNNNESKDYSFLSKEIIILFSNNREPRWLQMYPYTLNSSK